VSAARLLHRSLTFPFVSNIDPTDRFEATRVLDPVSTLFIVASKIFTTQETLTSANDKEGPPTGRRGSPAGALAYRRRRTPGRDAPLGRPCRPGATGPPLHTRRRA
jgi:hypothetical protein